MCYEINHIDPKASPMPLPPCISNFGVLNMQDGATAGIKIKRNFSAIDDRT